MSQRPNIIFIITDQQRFDTIAALGFPFMETPNMDRLVNEGVTFTNCFITAASCAPARASLFTGYYPHTTGILKNADLWRRSWIEQLAKSGYRCINIGKMHSYPYDTPLGFHERYVVENKDRYLEERFYFDEWDKAIRIRGHVKQQRELYRQRDDYRDALGAFDWNLPEDLHSDMFVGEMACWWLESKPVTEPLFMEIGFPGPHPPYDPIPRYTESYLKKELPLLPVSQQELDLQPEPFKILRQHNQEVDHDSVVLELNPTEQQRHRQRAYYLANVTMIDEKIGKILQTLETKGYLENSIVIFTSDHGDCLTDHGHSQKWTMYDTITKMPLVVWSPGRFAQGKRIDGLCQQMDIGPAILEMAQAEVPQGLEAKSLLPAIESKPWSPRDFVYAEQAQDGILTGTQFMTMIRSTDWKLVHFLDEPWGQLFDLKNDPNEVDNLWDHADHIEKKRELLANLREWRIRSGYQTSNWSAPWR
jgi:arylsulfatase A-like enzyme